jgi:hypothetical protein
VPATKLIVPTDAPPAPALSSFPPAPHILVVIVIFEPGTISYVFAVDKVKGPSCCMSQVYELCPDGVIDNKYCGGAVNVSPAPIVIPDPNVGMLFTC